MQPARSTADSGGRPRIAPAGLVAVGVAGADQNAAAAVCAGGQVLAFCEQERVTRVRRAGMPGGALPTEAIDTVLRVAGMTQADIGRFACAEERIRLPSAATDLRLDHHHGHAATTFHLSSFETAAVLVCDRQADAPESVWTGTPAGLLRQDWAAGAVGFARLYAQAAELFGFPRGQEHQLEGLARLAPGADAERFAASLAWREGELVVTPEWPSVLLDWLSAGGADPLRHRARVASAFQSHVASLLVALLCDVRARTGQTRLAVGGGLFYNTYFNTRIRQAGVFDDVFVPPNPGNAGLAIGSALAATLPGHGRAAGPVSPFLGPAYDAEEIKRTLDNCKLSYECVDEGDVVGMTVDALVRGRLVGWFQGRMEWGHRALGHRSILASPLAPYVLDNLNVFLKQRPHHRAYGVSVPAEDAGAWFEHQPVSPYMECQYEPVDPERLRPAMPEGTTALRVQTVSAAPDDAASARFRRLHQAFGDASGVPVLINTSFNGFSEPIVCSPRDAIRVFFGSGLDLLVLDRFLVRK